MISRFSAYVIPASLITIAAVCFACGLRLPEYSVPNGPDLLFGDSWREYSKSAQGEEQRFEQWNQLRARILTRHFVYCDLGWTFMGLCISILVLFITQRVIKVGDLRQIRTPKSRGRFHLYAAITWLSFIPCHEFYLQYIHAREDPPFMDNMAIPIETILTFALGLLGLPVILLGVWLVTKDRSLPIRVFDGVARYPTPVSIAVCVALVLAVIILLACIISEPPLVPSLFFTVYLLLCGKKLSSGEIRPGLYEGRLQYWRVPFFWFSYVFLLFPSLFIFALPGVIFINGNTGTIQAIGILATQELLAVLFPWIIARNAVLRKARGEQRLAGFPVIQREYSGKGPSPQ